MFNWIEAQTLSDLSTQNLYNFDARWFIVVNILMRNFLIRYCILYLYHFCQFQSMKTSRRTWLTVTGGLAGFLVGFMLLLYLMHRHNVSQTKTKAEKLKKATPAHDPDMQATLPILPNKETLVSHL